MSVLKSNNVRQKSSQFALQALCNSYSSNDLTILLQNNAVSNMANLSRLEIASFVLLAFGGLFAVLSTTSTYWRLQKTEKEVPLSSAWETGQDFQRTSYHGGLFKICATVSKVANRNGKNTTSYQLEKCMSTVSSPSMSYLGK